MKRKIHDLWKGQKHVKSLVPELPSVIGKYHYRYSSKKGTMSLIKVFNGSVNKFMWEICGGGITKQKQFPTKTKADKFIRSALS